MVSPACEKPRSIQNYRTDDWIWGGSVVRLGGKFDGVGGPVQVGMRALSVEFSAGNIPAPNQTTKR
jgi:hypothetical protein